MFRSIKYPLYAPEDVATGTLTADDVLDSLNEPDEEVLELDKPKKSKDTETTEESEDSEEETEEVDELTDLEDELTDPTDEDLEITLHVSRREIKTKYPQFFKDFPSVEKALYREQAYTEVFPTVADAKDAHEKATVLSKFESDLIDGNTEKVLSAVKSEDPNAFNKIVDNYLPTLAKVDQTAYYHVLGKVLQTTVMQMIAEANRLGTGKEDSPGNKLELAATLLHQFAFGTTEFKQIENLAKVDDKKDDSVDKDRQDYNEQRFNDTRSELSTKISNVIKGTIEQNIDKNESMSDFVREYAVNKAVTKINELIQKDTRFKAILDKAWENAARNNYSNESKDKIRQAYLSKFKTLAPAVIKSVRIEALKGNTKRSREAEEGEEEVSSNLPKKIIKDKDKSTSSVNRLSGKSERDKAKQIPRGTKTLDFLMSD